LIPESNEKTQEKAKLNFNYKRQNIQIKPLAINSSLSTRRELISVTSLRKKN